MSIQPGPAPVQGQAATASTSVSITPAPGSQLEELLSQRDTALARAAEAAAQAKAINDAIKAAVTTAHPGAEKFDIAGTQSHAPLVLRLIRTWRLDAKRMKRENPHLYVEYAVQGSHWELREAGS